MSTATKPKEMPNKAAAPGPEEEASDLDKFDADSVVVMPVNEDSKKIRQILSNDTSMKIMELLKTEKLSASEVAEKLQMPLTTVKYNIDQMVEHDLVRIQRIKYSEKGRQVKIYETPEKIIVFAPEKMSRVSLISMLQKYAFAFVAAAFAGFGLNYIYQRYMGSRNEVMMKAMYVTNTSQGAGEDIGIREDIYDTAVAAEEALQGTSFIHDAIMSFNDWFFQIMDSHAFWFIAGALFVCVAIWVMEHVSVKRSVETE